mmetsp:Transcript_26119/g.80368  ORF Transcript_26119/g.80368 Transcript_26119/m.80368 type:complete len:105 (-) Transcript_26119:286-600(-)
MNKLLKRLSYPLIFFIRSWHGGTWWSEYSLYRLALDAHGLFAKLHALPTSNVLCRAIWFKGQLPWDSVTAFQDPSCVFSLVQSTTGISPSAVATGVSHQLASPY